MVFRKYNLTYLFRCKSVSNQHSHDFVGPRKCEIHTFGDGKVCHFTLSGVAGRPPTFQERDFSLAKQHFLSKSGNLGNRDLVVRVGMEMTILVDRSEPLLFKSKYCISLISERPAAIARSRERICGNVQLYAYARYRESLYRGSAV